MWLAIPSYLSYPTSLFDISCVTLISKSKNWAANELAKLKKWLIIILKDFIKQSAIKQTQTLLSFSFRIDYCISVFSSLVNRVLGVLCMVTCLTSLRAYVLPCLACLAYSCAWRASVLTRLTCFSIRVLCLRACYDACLACLALAYLRVCLIIYFVCINQGFAIK